ncbi:MAG: sensor histidine kinase [Gorillibacterium sp.]|nr:sensor histidine kinase [Gorillibacterium sp.]
MKHGPMRKSMWLRQIVYKLSLKQRIWLSFVLLITLSILATGVLSYLIASAVVQKNAFQSSQDTVNKSAQVLDEKLRNIANSMRALMFSDPFKSIMSDVQRNDKSKYYNRLSDLQPVFSQVSFGDSAIESILIATPIGDFYSTVNFRTTASFYESPLYEDFKKTKRGLWVKGHVDPFFSGEQRVVSLVIEGVSESALKETLNVYVVVNIKEKALMRLSTRNLSNDGHSYYVMDSKGIQAIEGDIAEAPIWTGQVTDMFQQISEATQGSFFYEAKKSSYLINYSRLEIENDWMVLGVQSKKQLLREVSGIQRTTLYVAIFFILLSLLFSNVLTNLLLRPLHKLHRLMRSVEDNHMDVRFESQFQDEVAQVGYRFNSMLDEINLLFANVKNSEKEKRKAEMKALTAQMNPHFFYNTLYTIYCKSILGENKDASEMILALSQMFQIGLNTGRDLIPLRDEISHVEQYVAIQQKSYECLFTFRIHLEDESLTEYVVPKLMLQPLVENCILHGFNDRTSGGVIDIYIAEKAGKLQLTVTDNGRGMLPEKVRTEGEQRDNGKHGYAMNNIVHRLKLYYGEAAELVVISEEGKGVTVEIQLPMHKEESEMEGKADETVRN